MIVYELTHIFFRYEDEIICSPKSLGIYYSYESVKQAIQYYCNKPGFCENQDAFSVRERNVSGIIVDDTVYEVVVYLYTKDYEFETEIELGFYGDEDTAQNKLHTYCCNNSMLVNANNIIAERIVNVRFIEKKEWSDGFQISD